jgi:hypothetical protein
MRLLEFFFALSILILSAVAVRSQTLTVYAWPLSTSSPLPYAEVKISTASDKTLSAEIISKPTPPTISKGSDELVRVGLYNPATGSWSGSAALASIFGAKVDRKILLHVDSRGEVFHVGITAEDVPDPAKAKIKVKKSDKKAREAAKLAKKAEWRDGQTTVEVVPEATPPFPVLNKLVVLNAEGLVDTPLGQEKTFLQKYVIFFHVHEKLS